MNPPWLAGLLAARVFDLEQPRHAGMPIWPGHRPGYFYALHRRHRDTYSPQENGPRAGASGVVTMMEHTGTHIEMWGQQPQVDSQPYGAPPTSATGRSGEPVAPTSFRGRPMKPKAQALSRASSSRARFSMM